MTVLDFYQLINSVAPFDMQEEYDNSGFLIGSSDQIISSVLFALDLTERVIDEAVSLQAQLIVTHHPVMFSARKQITDLDYESRLIMRLIRENISLISAHTNLDRAAGGMNDILASACGLTDITGDVFYRIGLLPNVIVASQLKLILSDRLHTDVRLMGEPDKLIRRIGLCSGAGSDEWEKASLSGIDAFISGEIKHHHALAMSEHGIVSFECGHYATELPGIFALSDALQSKINHIEYNLRFYKSAVKAYASPISPSHMGSVFSGG